MNKQQLLTHLTKPGVQLVDSSGLLVSPRTQTEINCFSAAVQLRQRMAAIEAEKHFPSLQTEYRQLRDQLTVHCGLLQEFLDTVAEKLETNEYSIQMREE